MKTKRLFFPLLISTLILSSCNINKKTIGVFVYNLEDTFINHLSELFTDELKKDYNVNTYDACNSQLIQNRQIVDAIEKHQASTLIINMVDRLSSNTIISKAKDNDIPIIFYNREPVYSDIQGYNNIYYVGTSPKQEGENQADMAMNLLGDKDNYNKKFDKNGDNVLQCVFIRGEQSHQDTEIRTYSCLNKLINSGYDVEVLDMDYADWTKAKGYQSMESFYKKYGNKIEFVFSNNDDMALGAIEYLLDAKVFKKNVRAVDQPFPIVGVDGTKVGLEAVKNGYMYGTTINNAYEQAHAITELIKVIDKKMDIKDFSYKIYERYYIYIEGQVVTNDNVEAMIAKV